MKQMEISKWLKGITVVVALMGLVFFFLIMPLLATQIKEANPNLAYLFWPGIVYGCGIAVGCYSMLYFFWTVCNEIGKDNSFSKENANAFVKISRVSLVMAVYWFAGIIFLTWHQVLWPMIGIFMIGAVLIQIIVAILAAALSHLILKAYQMKEDNELTI